VSTRAGLDINEKRKIPAPFIALTFKYPFSTVEEKLVRMRGGSLENRWR
jgi:hypothetical protein